MSLRPTVVVRRLRRRVAQEQGAVIVVVAVSLIVFLGFAALAIDLGSLYRSQRQAQAAADAGALAAADDLGSSSSTAAPGDGTNYATTNYPGSSPTVSVSTNGTQVTVKDTATTKLPLAGLLGIPTGTVSATAVAGAGPGSPCVTPTSGTCYAIFASDTTCGSGHGITMSGAGNTITGIVHSNGSLNLSGGNQTLGATTVNSPLSSCYTNGGSTGDTFDGAAQPTAVAPIATWPDDFSQVLTPCSSAGPITCTGPNGTPSYGTQAAATFTFGSGDATLASGNVYCAYGSGGGVNVANPATWTGSIDFQSAPLGSSSSPIQGTWVGGTITIDHKSYLSTQTTTPTYPLFYATTGNITMSAGSDQLNGAIFDPNGTITFSGAGSTANFLEGKDVTFDGGNFSGDGPTVPSGGTTGGGVALLQ
jgi:Flp pilus assembly protein TadG